MIRVLHPNHLPTSIHKALLNVAVIVLILDRLDAPQWLWGVFGAIYFLALCGVVARVCQQEFYDVEMTPRAKPKP